jgi:polysaccharide export outer membrane protein
MTAALRGTLLAVVGVSSLLSGCSIAPGSYLEFQSLKDAKPDAGVLNNQVSVTTVDAGVIRRLSAKKSDDASGLLAALESERGRYEYRVGPGDILSIIVYDHPELTIPAGEQRSAADSGNLVNPDGTIFYPYTGRIRVDGQTVDEIRENITSLLSEYIRDPQIEVRVAQFNSKFVFVTGAVNKPGRVALRNTPLTLIDAVQLASGFTPDANHHELKVTRQNRTATVSSYELLKTGDLSQNIVLRPGDLIHVPDDSTQRVYVMGEVNRPGQVSMGATRLTLTDVITEVGGIKESSADAAGVFVIRPAVGSERLADVYQFDLRNSIAYVFSNQFRLTPNDIVYVSTTELGRLNRVIDQVTPALDLVNLTNTAETSLRDLVDLNE